VAEQMKELSAAEISFQDGDEFFAEEHEKYQELSEKMKAEGYSYEEIESLQNRYREKGKVIFAKDSEYKANLRLVGNLIAEMQQMEKQLSVTAITLKDTEKNMEENMQPKR
jgi:DNA-directed RNA polymerase sigma subunit (sigma70/sigma32)